MQKQKIDCKNCKSVNVVKKGFAKNKLQTLQKYQCKDCNRIFTLEQTKGKTYPLKLILKAISTYNLGYTLEKTKEKINKKYNLNITTKSINNWINQYKTICTFARLRKEAIKNYSPKTIINKKPLNHIQPYTFKYHKAKLDIANVQVAGTIEATNNGQDANVATTTLVSQGSITTGTFAMSEDVADTMQALTYTPSGDSQSIAGIAFVYT
jgi:transposase-like protein